jgi:hypothetical protein
MDLLYDIFFRNSDFQKDVQNFDNYLVNTHFLGSKTFYDFCIGNQSKREVYYAKFVIFLCILIAFKSIMVNYFNKPLFLILLGDISQVMANPVVIVNLGYFFVYSGVVLERISFLMDRKIIINTPIIEDTYFKITKLDSKSVYNDRYLKSGFILAHIMTLLSRFSFLPIVVYIISYGYLSLIALIDNKLYQEFYSLICLLIWYLIQSIGGYFCC